MIDLWARAFMTAARADAVDCHPDTCCGARGLRDWPRGLDCLRLTGARRPRSDRRRG